MYGPFFATFISAEHYGDNSLRDMYGGRWCVATGVDGAPSPLAAFVDRASAELCAEDLNAAFARHADKQVEA